MRKLFTVCFLLIIYGVQAQTVLVNTVGKDPFNGKAETVLYKTKEGEWSFQSFPNAVIKTTFKPAGYTRGENISDAVIGKVEPVPTKVTAGISQTIEWENQAKVIIQHDHLYYKMGNAVKVKSAAYFAQGETHGFRFQLTDGEHFFGGGERALPMDRRGSRLNLYNAPSYGYGLGAANLNFSVPFILSSDGYGIFFDNPSRGYLDIGLTDKNTLEAGFVSGELTFYIVFGDNPDQILNNYTTLTGRQPLPPRWALGNLVSRFGYRSEAQVKEVVAKMRREDFPMDGLILDLFWFGDSIKGTLGNFDWVDAGKWPDPKQMIGDLKKQYGLNTVLITEPYILEGTKTWDPAQLYLATDKDGKPYILSDFYFGKGGLLDIFRKSTQNWIWQYYRKQMGNGVAGWWLDLAEPEKHPEDMQHDLKDEGVQRPMMADEVHNVYGHYWSKLLFEKFEQDYSDTRLFLLNRAGFAGSQRYSIFPWTGDVGRDWSGLKAQLPVLLGMSLSGIPYIHSDAGGFAATDKADPELYTRWLEFAAFTPVFRPHGTALGDLDPTVKNIPSEPCFQDDPYKSIVRNYIHLRYQMLPYNYTLSYQQSVYGKPLMRPLYYYDFSDANTLQAGDEYYWGDELLVAPVTTQGATTERVYLPAGNWYDFYNDSIRQGHQWYEVPAGIGQIPLFVKAGSFIPLWSPADTIRSTETYDARKDWLIRYYPSTAASAYSLFDDDGSSTGTLEKAKYELLHFAGQTQGSTVLIDITTNNANNYKRKQTRKFRLAVPLAAGAPKEVRINGKPVAATDLGTVTGSIGKARFVTVPVVFDGKPMKVEIFF